MQDDFTSLFAFNRWANAKMLDACRKLTSEQYAAEPVPGWGSVRSTVYHIAVVTDGWLRTHANFPHHAAALRRALAVTDRDTLADALREQPMIEAETAIRAKNLVFAKSLADKAATIASQLGGGK